MKKEKIKLSNLEKNMAKIKWKPIVIEGISTKYIVSDDGDVVNAKTNYTLAKTLTKKGYQKVGIVMNGKIYNRTIHRLVAKAFIPNPEGKLTVNHKDGDKHNNHVSNLEWMTNRENIHHAWENGLVIPGIGDNANASKFTEDQIHQVCQLLEENKLTNVEISLETGVSESIVSKVKIKNCWTHISDEYDIPDPISNPKGSDHPASKYTNDQIHQVCKLLEEGKNTKVNIAKITGVGNDTISMILHRKGWTNISSDYKLPEQKLKHPSDDDKKIIEWINSGLDNEMIASKIELEFGMSGRKSARERLYRIKRNYKQLLSGSTTIENAIIAG